MCVHDKYNIDTLFQVTGSETWFALIKNFMDTDRFPNIREGCTCACKEKMIKITQHIFKNYMNSVCWYYHDVKIKDNMRGSSYITYYTTINEKEEPQNFDYTPQLEEDSSLFPDYPNTNYSCALYVRSFMVDLLSYLESNETLDMEEVLNIINVVSDKKPEGELDIEFLNTFDDPIDATYSDIENE